ncbi:MAG TPA: elongation factor P [Vicinamibacteria bacterium]|nr:elongation factor P [Vicinamibacteria bacterium]
MIQATQLKRGMCIKHDNDLYKVFEAQHKTPGNLRGMVQARLRHLKSGSIIEHRFRSVDMVERAMLDETEMEYLYRDGDMYHFMNAETYEQIGLSDEVLGDAVQYLIPNIKLKVEMYEGRPVGIELPLTVEMAVVETEPAIKGASVSNVGKPAKMETGMMVQVPAFISEGDRIRIDTATGSYIERAR